MPKTSPSLKIWALSGEIGLRISVPLIIFLLIGIKVDKILHTTPLFIIVAIVLSLAASVWSIARMIKAVTERQ